MRFASPPRRLRLHRPLAAALITSLACLGSHAQTPLAPLTLDAAVVQATARSQLIVAADAQAQAARELSVAAGRRPDPVLRLGIDNLPVTGPDRFSLTRDFMTMRSIGLMQELTREDKLNARTQRAEREVEIASVARSAAAAELQRDAALAWLESSFQGSLRELVLGQIAQAEAQAEATQVLYRAGKGAQADVFAARAVIEQLQDALAQAERQVAVAATQLSRWVGEPVTQPLAARPALALPDWTHGALAEQLNRHPQIAAAEQQEALAESEAAVARADKSADWSVEFMYSQRGREYSNMVSVNLTVPLQWDQKNRQDRELAARLAQVQQARARREEVRRAQEAEVRVLLQEWRSHDERLRRYTSTLLPLAAQRSEAALSAYRGGSGALTAVLDARRGELDLRIDQLRLEMERARVWAQLNYLLPAPDAGSHRVEASR